MLRCGVAFHGCPRSKMPYNVVKAPVPISFIPFSSGWAIRRVTAGFPVELTWKEQRMALQLGKKEELALRCVKFGRYNELFYGAIKWRRAVDRFRVIKTWQWKLIWSSLVHEGGREDPMVPGWWVGLLRWDWLSKCTTHNPTFILQYCMYQEQVITLVSVVIWHAGEKIMNNGSIREKEGQTEEMRDHQKLWILMAL